MDPDTLPAPPEPPQPHRSSTSCDRHPAENFTGFCPSCLCERLSLLEPSSSSAANGGRKSTSSAILKSLFKGGPTTSKGKTGNSTSFLPELRRTQSFSGRKNEGFLGLAGGFEPQRKSCDVRGRSTLFSLLSQDNNNQGQGSNLGQSARVEEEFHDCGDNQNTNGSEIEGVKEEISEQVGEIVEEEEVEEDFKTMKDHIDLDLHPKKVVGAKDLKELGVGGKSSRFWSAASVFSKKLKSWAKKNNQKVKKHDSVKVGGKKGSKSNVRSYRDTQSEIAEYGYGRRSCDTDPRVSFDVGRFSVDVAAGGRFSFDDPRCSFDEPPRASWDGYLMVGGRGFANPPPKMVPPMVSLVEDPGVVVSRKDGQILGEEQPRRSSVSINGGEDCCVVSGGVVVVPGGAAQTKDYYSDSSSRRRKSLDRSSSIRKTAAAVVAEMDEMKNSNNSSHNINNSSHNINNVCNGRMSTGSLVGIDRDVRDLRDQLSSNSRSLSRDDCSEMGFWDSIDKKGGPKKASRWRGWNIWGLIYRRGNSKNEEDDRFSRANGVGRSFSETWQDRGGLNRHMLRSNSSVSWRNSFDIGGGSLRKGTMFETNNNSRKKRGEGFVLERNRSARYSPSHNENRMLPMYLNPASRAGSRKGGGSKPAYSHSFVRSALRMY